MRAVAKISIWITRLLALAACTAPNQVARSIPTVLPPTVTATRASATVVSPTSASAAATVAPEPNAEPSTTQTSSVTPIVAPTASLTPSAATSTPQASLPRLAFRSNGLYLVAADGTRLTRLTTDPQDRLPAWSPDGQRLVFASDRGHIGNTDIFVVDADGTGLIPLTADPAVDDTPFWSPDGQFIAFTSDRDSKTPYGDIFVMRADGTQVRRVTTDPTFENIIGWSADSTRIFYEINHDGVWTIHAVNLDGTHDTIIADKSPSLLSPDGMAIAFTRTDGRQYDIWVSNVDGTNVRQLTNTPTNENVLTWSLDGKYIAFLTAPAKGIGLATVDVRNGTLTIITDDIRQYQDVNPDIGISELAWSPDNKYIAFPAPTTKGFDLAVVEVPTGRLNIITHDLYVEAGFAWSPK